LPTLQAAEAAATAKNKRKDVLAEETGEFTRAIKWVSAQSSLAIIHGALAGHRPDYHQKSYKHSRVVAMVPAILSAQWYTVTMVMVSTVQAMVMAVIIDDWRQQC
jgi:hypothetical protein